MIFKTRKHSKETRERTIKLERYREKWWRINHSVRKKRVRKKISKKKEKESDGGNE